MPFKEAVEFYRNKSVLPEEQFNVMAAEIGKYAHSLAFTVKGVAQADVLMDLHGEVVKAISAGQSFGEFREAIDEIMVKRGWSGLSPYRLDNIFRTNLQSAYNVGRYKQMTAISERRPYWQYDAVNDSRTRPSHMAHDGKVYHHLHPFWNTWYPPNGYRCRCRVNSLSAEEMGEEGLTEETGGTNLKPDEGFRYNPALQPWRPEFGKYSPSLGAAVAQDTAAGPKGRIMQEITALQPAGQARALVSITELRAQFPELSKTQFDRMVLDLARSNKVALHKHDFPFSLSEGEREKLVWEADPTAIHQGRNYYIGIVPI